MGKIYAVAKKFLNQYRSPAFLTLLCLSAIFWCLAKLSYTYTAEIPVSVKVEDNIFKVRCVAEGTGYRIVAHRFFIHKTLTISASDLKLVPVRDGGDLYKINEHSLQNAVSLKYADVRIVSLGDIPAITLDI